jgi:hypothetical protein
LKSLETKRRKRVRNLKTMIKNKKRKGDAASDNPRIEM